MKADTLTASETNEKSDVSASPFCWCFSSFPRLTKWLKCNYNLMPKLKKFRFTISNHDANYQSTELTWVLSSLIKIIFRWRRMGRRGEVLRLHFLKCFYDLMWKILLWKYNRSIKPRLRLPLFTFDNYST